MIRAGHPNAPDYPWSLFEAAAAEIEAAGRAQ